MRPATRPLLLACLLATAALAAGCLNPEEAGTVFDDVEQETPLVGDATAEDPYVDTVLVTEATSRLEAIVDVTDKRGAASGNASGERGPINVKVELLTPTGEPIETRNVTLETASGVPLTMETGPGALDGVSFPEGVAQRAIFRVTVDSGQVGVNGLLRAYAPR